MALAAVRERGSHGLKRRPEPKLGDSNEESSEGRREEISVPFIYRDGLKYASQVL